LNNLHPQKRCFPSPSTGEGVKKLIWFFLASFRRKPESRFFKDLRIDWTPVFTGVTNEFQFFHTFGEGRVGVILSQNIKFIHFLPPHPGPLPRGEREVLDVK